jgi:hypothetical protein
MIRCIPPSFLFFLVLGIGIVAAPAAPVAALSAGPSYVEYVIVTSELLAPEFEVLASWRTAHDLPSEVRTVEWITTHYPGADGAESVRLFLKDASASLGTIFALLGGDAEVVPVRYARSSYQTPTDILCDYYFMCLDGTWNADGDQHFGEVDDAVDLLPEMFVGRAPVSTVLEARAFVERTITYATSPAGPGYPASALFLAESLGETHGAMIAEAARTFIPPSFVQQRLYTEAENWPGAIELTRQAAIGEIDAGHGVVLHVGNGDETSWGLGDASLSIGDVQALNNAPRFSVIYAFSGWTAAFDTDDSIGEHWLTSPGGAAAYVGCTNSAWLSPSEDLINEWVRLLFSPQGGTYIGPVTAFALQGLADQAQTESPARRMIFTLALLGDPTLALRKDTPAGVDPVAPAPVPALALNNPTPNPFVANTTIVFNLASDVHNSELAIFDHCGRLRNRLMVGPLTQGRHAVHWSGEGSNGEVSAGTYFVRLEADGIALSRKVVRLR